MNFEHTDISPVVESVASDYGRRYSRYGADRDDMASQCYLWIYDHQQKVADWLDNDEYGIKQLARALRNEAHDYGESVKAQHLGYSRDDLVYYSKGMVRELLPSLFDEEAWTEPPVSEDATSGGRRDPATGGNWVATLADISQAFAKLGSDDQVLLTAFHRDEYANKMMAEIYGVTEQVMSYRHDRAVGRLVRLLGGHRPKPEHDEDCDHDYRWRGRTSQSNAAARAYQQSLYEEG